MQKRGKRVHVGVRIPDEWLPRIDALADRLAATVPGAARADALRVLIQHGLERMVELEDAGKKKTKRK